MVFLSLFNGLFIQSLQDVKIQIWKLVSTRCTVILLNFPNIYFNCICILQCQTLGLNSGYFRNNYLVPGNNPVPNVGLATGYNGLFTGWNGYDGFYNGWNGVYNGLNPVNGFYNGLNPVSGVFNGLNPVNGVYNGYYRNSFLGNGFPYKK